MRQTALSRTAPSRAPRRRLLRRVVVLFVAAVLIAAACADDGSDETIRLGADDATPGGIRSDADVEAGAIDVDFATLDGDTINFTDYAGSPLVVNFFAASCAPCVAEMPAFQSVSTELDGEVAFVGVSEDRRAEDGVDLVATTGVTYDTGWDPDGDIYAIFGGLAMPTTVLITADGQVTTVHAGALTADALRDLIAENLGVERDAVESGA